MLKFPPLRLTQTVLKGGCAAKVAAKELRSILAQVRFPPNPADVMVDAGSFDDAAIFKINSTTALVQTLDFFTPIVDTPRNFGRIAAANALSDVYAMGGRPVTAMSILAFPLGTIQNSVVVELLQGAVDTVSAAGASLVGGHTIDDDTLKFGLSVTGLVHPEHVWSNANSREGDVLILTKPLGTGALTAALKREEVSEEDIRDGIESMCLLNEIASHLGEREKSGIHAATDVTGFGLAGHALNMARASAQSFHFYSSEIPRFSRAMEFIRRGFLTKAHRTNREYTQGKVSFGFKDPDLEELFFDPQTSGGLLLSVSAEVAETMVGQLISRFPATAVVGKVLKSNAPHSEAGALFFE
ncbi:MAG: selenide, water dikinase SelD [Cryobacterium sp.]|nr:selenide, water dikinase SelD [Oligoflexia bacterium]